MPRRQRNAERLDAKLKIEEHWLLRGVTGAAAAQPGAAGQAARRCAPQRAAMLGPQGAGEARASARDDVRTKVGDRRRACHQALRRPHDHPRLHPARHSAATGSASSARNGAGKTTLLKLLTGEIAARQRQREAGQDARRRRHRPAAQADGAGQDACATCWPTAATGSTCCGVRKHIHGYLKEFLFDPGAGRRARSARCRAASARGCCWRANSRAQSNLLVLDEPTNDLDLETLDLLQEVIADYDGTVLIVSHDRDFLDRTVTVTLGLDGSGKVDVVAGGYEDWERSGATPPAEAKQARVGQGRRRRAPPRRGADQAHLQGPARLRPAAGADRGARRADRARRGGAGRSRSLYARPATFAR